MQQSSLVKTERQQYRTWIIHSLALDIFHTLALFSYEERVAAALFRDTLFKEATRLPLQQDHDLTPPISFDPSFGDLLSPIPRRYKEPNVDLCQKALQTLYRSIDTQAVANNNGWASVGTRIDGSNCSQDLASIELTRRLIIIEELLLNPNIPNHLGNDISWVFSDLIELTKSGTLTVLKEPKHLTLAAIFTLLEEFGIQDHKSPNLLCRLRPIAHWLRDSPNPLKTFQQIYQADEHTLNKHEKIDTSNFSVKEEKTPHTEDGQPRRKKHKSSIKPPDRFPKGSQDTQELLESALKELEEEEKLLPAQKRIDFQAPEALQKALIFELFTESYYQDLLSPGIDAIIETIPLKGILKALIQLDPRYPIDERRFSTILKWPNLRDQLITKCKEDFLKNYSKTNIHFDFLLRIAPDQLLEIFTTGRILECGEKTFHASNSLIHLPFQSLKRLLDAFDRMCQNTPLDKERIKGLLDSCTVLKEFLIKQAPHPSWNKALFNNWEADFLIPVFELHNFLQKKYCPRIIPESYNRNLVFKKHFQE